MKRLSLKIYILMLILTSNTVYADNISQDHRYFNQYLLNSELMSCNRGNNEFKTYCKKRRNTKPYSIVEYIYNGNYGECSTILVLKKENYLAYIILDNKDTRVHSVLSKMLGISFFNALYNNGGVTFSEDKKCGISQLRTSTILLCKYNGTFRSEDELNFEVKKLPRSGDSIFDIIAGCTGSY